MLIIYKFKHKIYFIDYLFINSAYLMFIHIVKHVYGKY